MVCAQQMQDLETRNLGLQTAVELAPEDHPDRAGLLRDLAGRLRERYEQTGDMRDLEVAISRSEAAVDAAPERPPEVVELSWELSKYEIWTNWKTA